jgi:formate hydrogenlyase transcriptional activator
MKNSGEILITDNISEAKERLEAIISAMPDLVFVIDEDGRHLDVMTSEENLLYKSAQEVKGKLINEIFSEEIAERFLTVVKETIKSGKTQVIEYDLIINDKKTFFEARTSPLSHKFNSKNCIVWIARDITNRIKVEKKLKESEERLRGIGNALPDLVFVVDEEGKYLEILTSEKNMLYIEAEKLKGQKIHDVFNKATADLFLGAILRTIIYEKSEFLEYELEVPAGKKWFEGRTGPIDLESDGKKCAVFIARDITDRKRAEELEYQNIYLQEELKTERNFGEIIGSSRPMKKVFGNIKMVAATDSTVLLTGETGVGKELIARAIHNLSNRKDNVLITVNCGALPPGLVESELFGHEKGAFTGATAQKKGKFELADRGTIFLDEIGELPMETQVKLLRVLQEREFERVGGNKSIKVDVRVIAATNKNLEDEVQKGSFRADLFYRLNIFPVYVPPLRERLDDIPDLSNYLVLKFSKKIGKRITGLSNLTLDKLQAYNWPGNVRELANILERAVILCQGRVIQDDHIAKLSSSVIETEEILTLEEAERRHILNALKKCDGVLGGEKGAAVLLGVNRSTLWSRMKKLGIQISKNVNGK